MIEPIEKILLKNALVNYVSTGMYLLSTKELENVMDSYNFFLAHPEISIQDDHDHKLEVFLRYINRLDLWQELIIWMPKYE